MRSAVVDKSWTSPVAAIDRRAGKYLTFLLGPEEFAIQVLKVREIIGIQDITAVPQTPKYVKGVINLRGKVVPVVDLRLKFNLPRIDYTRRTCIIVVQVQGDGVAIQTGIIVDEVSEVLNVVAAEIEDTPEFGEGTINYLLGIAKVKDSVIAPSTSLNLSPGTVAYMAPEQLNGRPITTATDIFALGAISPQHPRALSPE